MTTRDLYPELEATQEPLTPKCFAWFRKLGIPDRVIFGPRPYLGVGRITTHSEGLFEFHDEGEPAIIVPEGEPEVPGWGAVHDLIAFRPDNPETWWLKLGMVDLLGAYNIRPWKLSHTKMYENPLSWLRAGASGICLLDWGTNPALVLSGAGYLEVESPTLKTKLEQRITEAALEPFDIAVSPEVRNAA
jgi:hypothetical protein